MAFYSLIHDFIYEINCLFESKIFDKNNEPLIWNGTVPLSIPNLSFNKKEKHFKNVPLTPYYLHSQSI